MWTEDSEKDDVAGQGEELACEHFEERGWEVVARNWTRDLGEVDIIIARSEAWGFEQVTQIAFVEVKTREVSRGPLPELRVDHVKRRKLVTLGKLYLAENKLKKVLARFDVVGVDLDTRVVRHHASAFDGTGRLR